jgi:hypothetical protein
MATPKKQLVSFSASNSTSKYAAALEFERGDTRDQDNDWETETNVSEMDETRKELEDLQIRTIFSLVEDLEIEVGSKTMQKKLLFITNKQARKFDFTNISQVLTAMDITPAPQLVINLMPSGPQQEPFADSLEGPGDGTREVIADFHMHGETSKADLERTELNIMLFLQQCVLPVAIQTNAVVFMHHDACAMSDAFSELCEHQQEKMGGTLPFTTICVTDAYAVHAASAIPGSVSHALRHRSKRWKEHSAKVNGATETAMGPQHVAWNAADLPGGCTHNIVVDAVTRGKIDWGPKELFKNTFMRELQSSVLLFCCCSLTISICLCHRAAIRRATEPRDSNLWMVWPIRSADISRLCGAAAPAASP